MQEEVVQEFGGGVEDQLPGGLVMLLVGGY